MASDTVAIGIDLGTSNSCVALARGRTVEVIPNPFGENITASVVHFQEDGSIVVGNQARARIIHDPKHTVYSAKRLIGRYFFSEEVKKAQAVCSYRIVEGPNHSVRIQIKEEQFSLPEVSAMVLREMKSIAEEKLGQPVRQAVITVPAYFNDNQRQATRDAGRIAGLEVLRLLNEPTAAALAYGFGRGLNQRVAVYDFGGGTFDVSILEIGKDVFEVLATSGDTYLGGDDLDDRLIDLLADEFVQKEGINLRGDPYTLEKLKIAAEQAKRTLSIEESVEVNIPDICVGADGQPRSVQRVVNAREYTALIMDLVQRTFKVCDEALQQANLVARDLDGVILVGGPTRLPMIRSAVREYFQQEPKTDVNPDEVVAMGAAIHAASLVAPAQQASSYLLDVTPLSLRIGVAGGLAEPVIERNTPVPIEQTRTFTTVQDNQERVKIRVYQGESRKAEENELLGQFEFSGFKRAARGEVRIDVTFEINGDGIVNVTALERESGQQASTEIMLSSGLSNEEMQKILSQRRTDRVQSAKTADVGAPPKPAVAKAKPAPPAPAARPAPPPVAAPAVPELGASDDDLDVLPDDDDLEAVLDEVGIAADPEPIAPPPPPPMPKPAPAAAPKPALAAAKPAAAAPAPRPAAPAAQPAPLPIAPPPAPVARAPEPDPVATDDDLLGPGDLDLNDVGDLELGGAVDGSDHEGQDHMAQELDAGAGGSVELDLDVAPPPAEFESAIPTSENDIDFDPGEGDLDVELGRAGEFANGVDGGPMIGGGADFSEGDFDAAQSAAASDEDPNAKTQPDQNGQTVARPPAAPAAAPAGGEGGLFGEAGADLSSFGDDGDGGIER